MDQANIICKLNVYFIFVVILGHTNGYRTPSCRLPERHGRVCYFLSKGQIIIETRLLKDSHLRHLVTISNDWLP